MIGDDWRLVLEGYRNQGVMAQIDSLARRRALHLKCRQDDEAFFREQIPHALFASGDGASAFFDDSSTLLLDCRPLAEICAEPRVGGRAGFSLIRDGLGLCLAGADDFRAAATPAVAARNYFIFSTPRSGSTFFCDLLAATGVLGWPSEHFKAWMKPLRKGAGLGFREILNTLRPYATSPNGVFGTKIIIDDLFALLPEFAEEAFAEFSRSPCYLLIRGDKGAQALSNVRANALSLYHVTDATRREAVERLKSFHASIEDLFEKERWLLRQEADFLSLARERGVRLKLLSYEALAQSSRAAQAILDDIGAELGVATPIGYLRSHLLKINELGSSEDLSAYRAFRRGALLFSARSEPGLAQVLGQGWRAVESWGAAALSPGEQEFLRPGASPWAAMEALLTFGGRQPPAHMMVDGAPAEIVGPAGPSPYWRLHVRMGEADRLRLSFPEAAVNVEEVVFFKTEPDWVATSLRDRRAVLRPA